MEEVVEKILDEKIEESKVSRTISEVFWINEATVVIRWRYKIDEIATE